MPRARMLLSIGVIAVMVISTPAGAGPANRRMIDAVEEDCEEFVPASYSLSGITDDGKTISLDVRILLDVEEGVQIEQLRREAAEEPDPDLAAQLGAQAEALHQEQVDRVNTLLDASKTSYAPLDIDFKLNGFEYLSMLDEDGTPRNRTVDSQSIIDLAKAQLGGERPEGSDVVYVLTDLDMTAPTLGAAVAGQADCIGGVRYANRAFAVGEIPAFSDLELGPVTFYYKATAKIAAHEIGHLMGAHHHYQDCVEGIPTELEAGEPSPCTLMTNFVDFQSLNFSVLEGAVVRGHAVDFADSPAD